MHEAFKNDSHVGGKALQQTCAGRLKTCFLTRGCASVHSFPLWHTTAGSRDSPETLQWSSKIQGPNGYSRLIAIIPAMKYPYPRTIEMIDGYCHWRLPAYLRFPPLGAAGLSFGTALGAGLAFGLGLLLPLACAVLLGSATDLHRTSRVIVSCVLSQRWLWVGT